jgi:anti-sigma factor RsiW
MNCEQVCKALDVFINGRMSGEESRAVRVHLASCAACASRLSPSERIEILPALDDGIEPSADFAARFQEKLQRRKAAGIPSFRARKNRISSSWFRVMGEVGALAAILVAGIYLARNLIDTSVPSDYMNDPSLARNLNLLEDMAVINNLDLLENFDTIENMTPALENLKDRRSSE